MSRYLKLPRLIFRFNHLDFKERNLNLELAVVKGGKISLYSIFENDTLFTVGITAELTLESAMDQRIIIHLPLGRVTT